MEKISTNGMSLVFGYLFLGLLIGYITGLTSAEVTQIILTAFLALLGGKIMHDISSAEPPHLKLIGRLLLAFSIAFLVGLNVGIYIKVNNVFTRKQQLAAGTNPDIKPETILRNDQTMMDLQSKYERGEISKDSIVILFFQRK